MRQMSTVLLSALTVCALGQAANANNQVPGQTPAPQTPPSPPHAPNPDVPPPVPTDTTPPARPDPSSTPSVNGPTPASPSDTNPPPPAGSPAPMNPDGSNATNPDGSGPSVPTPDSAVPPPPPPTAAPSTVMDAQPTTTTSVVEVDPYGYEWYEPGLMSGVGVSTILGGGITGFTDRTMRNTTSDIGGMWDLKVAIGSHMPLALELGYVGSATNINGLPTGQRGTLIGTTAEADLRFNVLPHAPMTPYVFGGVGWQRYDVTQATVSLSDGGMNDHDNLLEFPVGGGLAYRMQGFVFDLRGTFRATTDNDLVLTAPRVNGTNSNSFANMHSWEASAAVGYEF